MAMNLASAGPLLCVWLARRSSNPLRDGLGRTLAWLSTWALVLGMLTGGAILCFPSSAKLLAALSRFPTRALWFAAAELAFSLACLLLYAYSWRALQRHRWWHALLALLASTNLLYHFPPLMSVLGKLAADPHWAKVKILDRAALLPLMQHSEILALSLHFLLASFAVAAIALLWLLDKGPTEQDAQKTHAAQLTRPTASIALLASVLQLPSGIWLLISLPQPAQRAVTGASMIASLAFLGALLLTFLLLQRLLTLAIGPVDSPNETPRLRPTCWLLGGLILLMTLTLQSTRNQRHAQHPQKSRQEKSREANSSTASGSTIGSAILTLKPFVSNE